MQSAKQLTRTMARYCQYVGKIPKRIADRVHHHQVNWPHLTELTQDPAISGDVSTDAEALPLWLAGGHVMMEAPAHIECPDALAVGKNALMSMAIDKSPSRSIWGFPKMGVPH